MVREARLAWDGPGRLESLVREETELPEDFQELQAPRRRNSGQRRTPLTSRKRTRRGHRPPPETGTGTGTAKYPPAA